MTAADYRFVDRWRVEGTLDEVTEIMTTPEDLPRWWPSIYLSTEVIKPGDEQRLGQVVRFSAQGGRLLYRLVWVGETVEVRHPHGYRLDATGDFVGTADWTFEQDGPFVDMTLEWTIRVNNPLLRYGSFFMKPILANNHRWAMKMGERSLQLELARRHASTPEERAKIPPPPPALTARRVLPVAGTALAGTLGLVGLRRKSRR